MLKCCVRPLITLVLALMATGAFATLSDARIYRTPEAPVLRAENSPPRPFVTSGEPDQPLSPPPRLHGGITTPRSPEPPNSDGAVDGWGVFWWTGWVWALWFARATF